MKSSIVPVRPLTPWLSAHWVGLVTPVPVEASQYFTPAQIERARHFRDPQLATL